MRMPLWVRGLRSALVFSLYVLMILVAYYGLMLATMKRLWTLASGPDALARRVAFASIAGLLAYAFDGMSSPLFREPTTYLYFWIIAGLSAALLREAATAPR